MGGGAYSESSSASAADKITTGPVTFGSVQFGAETGTSSYLPWIIGGVVALAAAWFVTKDK